MNATFYQRPETLRTVFGLVMVTLVDVVFQLFRPTSVQRQSFAAFSKTACILMF